MEPESIWINIYIYNYVLFMVWTFLIITPLKVQMPNWILYQNFLHFVSIWNQQLASETIFGPSLTIELKHVVLQRWTIYIQSYISLVHYYISYITYKMWWTFKGLSYFSYTLVGSKNPLTSLVAFMHRRQSAGGIFTHVPYSFHFWIEKFNSTIRDIWCLAN